MISCRYGRSYWDSKRRCDSERHAQISSSARQGERQAMCVVLFRVMVCWCWTTSTTGAVFEHEPYMLVTHVGLGLSSCRIVLRRTPLGDFRGRCINWCRNDARYLDEVSPCDLLGLGDHGRFEPCGPLSPPLSTGSAWSSSTLILSVTAMARWGVGSIGRRRVCGATCFMYDRGRVRVNAAD